jgi:hypothetical protein
VTHLRKDVTDMSVLLPDGRYEIEALGSFRLLTDFDGVLAVASRGQAEAKADDQSWQLTNSDDGTATLRCVGSSNYLALSGKSGPYYTSAAEPESWRIRALKDNHELVRVSTGSALWIAGILIDPTTLALQGIEADALPTRWIFTPQ